MKGVFEIIQNQLRVVAIYQRLNRTAEDRFGRIQLRAENIAAFDIFLEKNCGPDTDGNPAWVRFPFYDAPPPGGFMMDEKDLPPRANEALGRVAAGLGEKMAAQFREQIKDGPESLEEAKESKMEVRFELVVKEIIKEEKS